MHKMGQLPSMSKQKLIVVYWAKGMRSAASAHTWSRWDDPSLEAGVICHQQDKWRNPAQVARWGETMFERQQDPD
jgi:hypothetical protein